MLLVGTCVCDVAEVCVCLVGTRVCDVAEVCVCLVGTCAVSYTHLTLPTS